MKLYLLIGIFVTFITLLSAGWLALGIENEYPSQDLTHYGVNPLMNLDGKSLGLEGYSCRFDVKPPFEIGTKSIYECNNIGNRNVCLFGNGYVCVKQ